ncbi:sensor histidine kinase [Dyella mobilis]|uniref:histidine kinase n=1 Tax=Dyella mobilis TaxID=1849582 RepID=A0ABS2KMT6_9GAMM|nr:ATP-binding protein [Dyella mobilis]MBM7132117.1 hypothetical protein [Dyella mobilis]GLQ95897.1 histidine kinase [Dyella mobilis]
MLPFHANSLRPSRTATARIFFIGTFLLLAAFSWHPMGASMSGAFDKVLFDTAARLFAHPSTKRVAVVSIDPRDLRGLDPDELAAQNDILLKRLDRAASVTLDDGPLADVRTDAALAAVRNNGRVVVPASSALAETAAGHGQHRVTVGHYGVVTGLVPHLPSAQGGTPNIVLEAIRVSGVQHASERARAAAKGYALSIAPARTDATLVMLGKPDGIPRYSYADVIGGKVAADAFEHRAVFVGQALGDEGGFQISSLNLDAVSRVELDALMADAVISGNVASELPGLLAVPVYVALALGMVLICTRLRGHAMHWAALGWLACIAVFPALLLAMTHRWLGLGLLPLVCVCIYAYFAWERLSRTLALLNREIGQLRAIAGNVGMAGTQAPIAPARTGDPVREVRQAMREIRSLQITFVNLINQLPYPVFVVTKGIISVWNAQASELLTEEPRGSGNAVSLPDVQHLVTRHCQGDASRSEEVLLGGRDKMLLYVPYAGIDAPLDAEETEARASFLVCLMDITDIKRSVMHDRQALRHIAHDLRSPLSTIMQLIEERASKPPQTSYDQAFIDDLRRQADYSLRVAKDFLQLSRAEQIHRDTLSPATLLDIATEAIDQLWPAAESKAIDLIGPQCALENTLIAANANMLIRALVNVIDNALKYSPSHTSITVRIEAKDDRHLSLHVIDQGIGIAQEDLTRLFDPFFQVAGKADGEMGVGLGLPFVKAVIDRHGGEIGVSSHPGRGTDVCIVLPAAKGHVL